MIDKVNMDIIEILLFIVFFIALCFFAAGGMYLLPIFLGITVIAARYYIPHAIGWM